ncbi:hypothetical protein [Rhodococcus sovatensis]|uniref:DNA topoisomerase (ATP-hydrolyzing) n=1 Tax=Rhodococcus sovatensis TaxID=1805840 RepID=A0ABZ2PEZ1_9NOCA
MLLGSTDDKRKSLGLRLEVLKAVEHALHDLSTVFGHLNAARDRRDARGRLVAAFSWSAEQADAVLALQFERVNLESRNRITQEINAVQAALNDWPST